MKKPLRDFRWIGPYLVEKVLPNNFYIVRKLKTNKTQILHRNRLRKYKPEKPAEDNYLEAQWQSDDNIVIPHDDLYTIAWEAETGGHLFAIPIICSYPIAIDFHESYTQGPESGIVPRSYFHDSSDGHNREVFPTSDPSLVHPSITKYHGQSQEVETTRKLHYIDSSTRAPESSTDLETAYQPMQQPPMDRLTTLQRLRSTIVLPKLFRKTNLVILEAANTTYGLILTLMTEK